MAQQSVNIVGVDFSGRETRNTTWVTEAVVQNGVLSISKCHRPSFKNPSLSRKNAHDKLVKLLRELPNEAVAAMDFPFSVPRAFAEQLAPVSSRMPHLWCATAKIDYKTFKTWVDCFIKTHGEMIRRGDAHFGGPFSPLKPEGKGPPTMRPMTFYGMKMLHRLWEANSPRFRIPPLPDDGRTGPVLIETMPGVLLRTFGLPAEGYKDAPSNSGAKKKKAKENRETILKGLEDKLRAGYRLSLKFPDRRLRDKCIEKHDCLDSLVAAIAAALWKLENSAILHPRVVIPPDEEIKNARLEGWLYAPKPLPNKIEGP